MLVLEKELCLDIMLDLTYCFLFLFFVFLFFNLRENVGHGIIDFGPGKVLEFGVSRVARALYVLYSTDGLSDFRRIVAWQFPVKMQLEGKSHDREISYVNDLIFFFFFCLHFFMYLVRETDVRLSEIYCLLSAI